MKHSILLLISIAVTGCKLCEFDIYEHRETQKYQTVYEEKVPISIFDKESEFIDNGIFFIPKVREAAWEPTHRSFISFYSKSIREIYILDVIASSENSNNIAKLEFNQLVKIDHLNPDSKLYDGYVPTLFGETENANEVFSNDVVIIQLRYRFKSDQDDRFMKFKIHRKRVKDIAWPT